MKDLRLKLRVFESTGEFYIMLVHYDGEDIGHWSGPYETKDDATKAAKNEAEREGMKFDE